MKLIRREVRRLPLLSIRIGTCEFPNECSYAEVYGALCSPSVQMKVPLLSRRNLRCDATCLGVALFL